MARDASLWDWRQDLAGTVTVRCGVNVAGAPITYFLNYAADAVSFASPMAGRSVLDGAGVDKGADVTVARWDVLILET